jgi:glycine cleavage system aminomethyltransferase T
VRFLLVSSAATTERDKDHIKKRMTRGTHASLVDLTSALAVFGVMGPASRDLLASLSGADLSDEAFGFRASREIDLGYYTVRATRITYVGELGWELYVPCDFAVGVFELLTSAGRSFGLANAGYYAIESMRLEKGYRAYGRELTPDYNPVEAGLLFACKLGTGISFLGREAVEKARAEGPRRRLVSFVLDDPAVMLWGGELVLRDGVAVGRPGTRSWRTSSVPAPTRSARAATSAPPPSPCARRSTPQAPASAAHRRSRTTFHPFTYSAPGMPGL